MDDRFHPLSILDYQDLRAAAFGLGSGRRSTSPVKTSDVENRAEFSSSSGDTNRAGLLAVRDVPGVAELRKRLLPLAHRLALMPDQLRRHVLKVADDALHENAVP
ncbi:hypothetical protein R1flu_017448 [Riccia fluitans]|uniref:Uncharacterized protein n=1 Tax=Riccia fluitans TaxID=41844 RepID=A0ABD1ZD00_9MARC